MSSHDPQSPDSRPSDSRPSDSRPSDSAADSGTAADTSGPAGDLPNPAAPTITPVWPSDPPRIGDFWLDGRITATAAGAAFLAHRDDDTAAVVVQLGQGAAGDKAARDRFAGLINPMHIDDVLARGGHEQDQGRLGRKFRAGDDDPVEPDDARLAPWVALTYDGSPKAPGAAKRLLSAVELELPPQGEPSGPDYTHYWAPKSQPGLTRVWPLPWPGRYDRAGWVSILVSWALMMVLAAIGVLIAILLFRNEPPMTPPQPQPSVTQTPPPSGSPPPSSSSASASPSPSPSSASPSPSSGSSSPTPSGSPTMSDSASPDSASPTPGESGSPGPGSPTPNSKL